MMITIPFILSITSAISIVLVKKFRPQFRYFWFIAIGGSILVFTTLLIWTINPPLGFSLTSLDESTLPIFSPAWTASELNLPIIISLSTLGLAVLLTTMIRQNSDPIDWASIFVFISLGILAVMSDNYISIALCWISIDVIDLISILRYGKENKSNDVVVALSIKLFGILLLIWSAILCASNGISMDLHQLPNFAGLFILTAAILRIGILPLVLPVNTTDLSKGIFTISRAISSVSGLILLVYLPTNIVPSSAIPITIVILGFTCIGLSVAWFLARNELAGRPYWILSFVILIISNSLNGNIESSISLLTALILCGGLVSLYSSRHKKNIWLPLLGLWGLSTVPFSLTYGIFSARSSISVYTHLPMVVGYSILLAGYIKHIYSIKVSSERSIQPKWVNLMYLSGLVLIIGVLLFLGLKQGFTNESIQYSWIELLPIGLAVIITLLRVQFKESLNVIKIQSPSFKQNYFTILLWGIYNLIRRIINGINFILEGDGGMLWSLVLLLLFVTILSQFSN